MLQSRSKMAIGVMTVVLLLAAMVPNVFSAPPAEGPMEVYRTVNFMVNYNPASCASPDYTVVAWPTQAQAALNRTFDILDALINSTPTVVVDACFVDYISEEDSMSTLAAAGPSDTVDQSTVPALPMANVGYPIALANAISGQDNNNANPEISLTANSEFNWDYSTTVGATPANQFDFVSTALHELIHGLGFVDSITFPDGQNPPTDFSFNGIGIYDTFLVEANGNLLTNLPDNSVALANAIQAGSGNVQWNGPNAIAANSNQRPLIFAPNPYQQGSSIGHLDDDAAENAGRLMRAATGAGPGSHTPSAVALMMLKDMGWSVNEASDYGDLPAAYNMTAQANDGARHIRNALLLGAAITTENDGSASNTATADTNDDGITRNGTWSNGANGGNIQATFAGGRGCFSGWIDWNNDNDFADAGEQVVAMQAVNTGSQAITFTVPNGTFAAAGGPNVTLFARFRLMPDIDGDGDCSVTEQKALAPQGTVFGGEVEDYQWVFNSDGSDGGTVVLPTLDKFIYLPMVQK